MADKRPVLLTCKHLYLKYLARALNAAFWLVSMVAKDGQNEMVLNTHKIKGQTPHSLQTDAVSHWDNTGVLRRRLAECVLPSMTLGG